MVIYKRHSNYDTRVARRFFDSTEDVDIKYDRGWWGVVVGGYHARMKEVEFKDSEAFPVFCRTVHTVDSTGQHPEWKNMEAFPAPPDTAHQWHIVKAGDSVRIMGDNKNWYVVTRLTVNTLNQKLVTVLSSDETEAHDILAREVTEVRSSYVSAQNRMSEFGTGYLLPGTRLKSDNGFYYVNRVTDDGVVVDTIMRHNMSLIGSHLEAWKGVDSEVYYEEVYVPKKVFTAIFSPVEEDMKYKMMILNKQELSEEYGGTLDTMPELPPPKRAPALNIGSIFKHTKSEKKCTHNRGKMQRIYHK